MSATRRCATTTSAGSSSPRMLARRLLDGPPPRHTIRFLYAPGTIGAITWLARNRDCASRIMGGMTLSCLGDSHPFTYKRTVDGSQLIDRAAALVLGAAGFEHDIIDFFPYGYDERQYNSPGFRLPVGALMRGRHGQFPEYHTSADNLAFVTGEHAGRVTRRAGVDRRRRRPQPGRAQPANRTASRNSAAGGCTERLGGTEIPDLQLAMLWVLNLADGRHDLLDDRGAFGPRLRRHRQGVRPTRAACSRR